MLTFQLFPEIFHTFVICGQSQTLIHLERTSFSCSKCYKEIKGTRQRLSSEILQIPGMLLSFLHNVDARCKFIRCANAAGPSTVPD